MRPQAFSRHAISAVIGACLTIATLTACSVEANDDAHRMVEKFAGDGEKAAAAKPNPPVPTADRQKAEAPRTSVAAKKAEKAEADRRAKAQRKADEVEMLARAAAEAEERRQEALQRAAEAERLDAERKAAEAQIAEQVRREAARKAADHARRAEADRAEQARRETARKAEEEAIAAAARADAARQAEQQKLRADAEERQREAQREAELQARKAERAAELDQLAEKMRRAQEAKAERSLPTAANSTIAAASPPPAIEPAPVAGEPAVPGRDIAATETRREQTILGSPGRATIVVVMKPGNKGIRRFEKSADPILCVTGGCYVSAGPGSAAVFNPGRRALGIRNTWGERAGACSHYLGCVFRNVNLGAAGGIVQPVDMRVIRHDRREQAEIGSDSGCRLTAGALSCERPIRTEDYRLWVIPESLAEAAGSGAVERLLASALAEAG